MKLNDLLDALGKEGEDVKKDLNTFLQNLGQLPDKRLQKIVEKISKYLEQLASGAIGEDECRQYMADIRRELASYVDKLAAVGKAKLQKLEKEFVMLVLEKVIPVIVKAIASSGRA